MNPITWQSSPTNPQLRRGQRTRPAYDCMRHPSTCPHEPKCKHGEGGRSNSIDYYAISDGKDALVLAAHTAIGVEGLGESNGFEFYLHTAEAIDEYDIRDPKPEECDLIEPGRCFPGGWWGIYADEFAARFKWNAELRSIELEALFTALEKEFSELRDHVYARRGTAKRCEHCEGRGYTGNFA